MPQSAPASRARDQLLVEVYRAHAPAGAVSKHFGGLPLAEVVARDAARDASVRGLTELLTTLIAAALQKERAQTREFLQARFRGERDLLAAQVVAARESGAVTHDLDPADTALLLVAASYGLQVQCLLDRDSVDMQRALAALGRMLPPEHPAHYPRSAGMTCRCARLAQQSAAHNPYGFLQHEIQ